MNEELVAALEAVIAIDGDSGWRRSRQEAPWRLTSSYVQLMAAYGFARLGAATHANECKATALEQLADVAGDPVHASLAECFVARIDLALDGRSRFVRLPDAVLVRRAGLDRVALYKVQRLWEVSWILAHGDPGAAAIDVFSHGQTITHRPVDFDAADAQERATLVADALEAASMLDRDVVHRRMIACVEALTDVPEALAMPILVRAIELVEALPAPPSTLRAALLTVIGQFGWGELVPRQLEPCVSQLSTEPVEQLAVALPATLQTLRRLDAREATTELLGRLAPRLEQMQFFGDGGHEASTTCWLAFAGALSFVGDPRGPALFEHAEQWGGKRLTLTQSLRLIRMIAAAHSLSTIAGAITGIGRLRAAHVRNMTDSFGTNTHYCISVLDFMESLILGLAEARVGRGPA